MSWRTAPGPAGGSGSGAAGAATLLDRGPASPRRAPSREEPGRLVLGIVLACIGFVALVTPKLPGNAGPVDLLILASVGAVFFWALHARARVHMPYAFPVAALMITGLVAAILSPYPLDGLKAVVQEIFLLLWCAAVASVCVTLRVLKLLLRVWVASATGWGAVLLLAVVGHVSSISGVGTTADKVSAGVAADSGAFRARLFFDQPNMAGNYFLIALFILVATGFPRRLWLRAGAAVVLLAALVVTGSNAALLSMLGGVVLTVFLHIRARGGMVKAAAAVGVVVLVMLGLTVTVGIPLVTAAQTSNNIVLRDTLGRAPASAAGRASLFEWQFKLYERGNLFGIGPNGTQNALGAAASPILKSAHNDYLGTLDERGPLGLLALFALMGGIIARLVAITRRPLPPRLAAAIPVPAALAGACLAFGLTGITHEILHYRWFWTLIAVVAAVHVLAAREACAEDIRPEASGRTEAPPGVPPPRVAVL